MGKGIELERKEKGKSSFMLFLSESKCTHLLLSRGKERELESVSDQAFTTSYSFIQVWTTYVLCQTSFAFLTPL